MNSVKAVLLSALILPSALSSAQGQSDSSKAGLGDFGGAGHNPNAAACTDFFQFACSDWLKANPIPNDRPRWGTFDALADRNRGTLKAILDEAVAAGAKASPADRRLADMYGSCMDEGGIERNGTATLRQTLLRIDAVRSKRDLPSLVAELHAQGVGVFFSLGAAQDLKNTTRVIATAGQGGLGLPDRDYYFRDDARSKELQERYVAHVERMFALLSEPRDVASAHAKTVLTIETALAKNALDVVSQRDPHRIYHLMKSAEFASLVPSFDTGAYLNALKAPPITEINVTEPEFFRGLDAVVAAHSLDALKTYLRWQAAHQAAFALGASFVSENFDFYGRALTGAKEPRPRWKRCVDVTEGTLGEALGAAFVARTFGRKGQARVSAMVSGLERALADDIKSLPWMSSSTKARALAKLGAMDRKVGSPDAFRDYSAVQIRPGDFLGNFHRANAFEFARQLAKIGKPVDRKEWTMSQPTVNAGYYPPLNSITFPVGILQPPFFDAARDDAFNYGGIGGVIGHEMTHGFDDEGSQFAADGNLADWWTAEDRREFDKRAGCLADQYGDYAASDGTRQDGNLTLGENTADNGGLRIAHMALMESLRDKTPEVLGGFSPEQRFFLGWGQVWCAAARPEFERLQVQTDPHSLPRHRVNGTLGNMPEFQKAFACPADAPMVRGDKACRVW